MQSALDWRTTPSYHHASFEKDDELCKTVLRQHQTRAAVKVVARCADPNRRGGLIWHSQGFGRAVTLITAARLILQDQKRFSAATVLLIVDDNELEGQLKGWVDRILGDLPRSGIAVERPYCRPQIRARCILNPGLLSDLGLGFGNILCD